MITDTTGAPLIGVSVALKGRASVGTSTDLNGRLVLEIPEDGVLIFSMIGFETQEVHVNGRTEINLVMKISASQLDDVVRSEKRRVGKECVRTCIVRLSP